MLAPDQVQLSHDGNQAELRITPALHGPISADDILTLLKQSEFRRFCPMLPVHEKAIKEVNSALGSKDEGVELFYPIAERKNGTIDITISKDKMEASALLTAPWGGQALTLNDILQALKNHQIKMGLKKKRITVLIKHYERLKPGQTCETIIAQGKQAVHGVNAVIERKVALARERLLHPQEREDGTVDMRDLGSMVMVKPNDVLMRKKPATEGIPGFNVLGETLPAKPGKDADFTPGEGTERSPRNSLELIATVSGQPVETAKGMQVDDVLQIKDVNVGFGHVNFKGSVLITGDVSEGMQVKSTGDITVMGFVDSATLEADGDIIVSKGIIGRQQPNQDFEVSAHIKAKGQICAQFVQYSELQAEGEVLVTKQLLHSHTKTNASLTVCDPNNRRGDLIGGTVHADNGVKAVVIGATAGTKTEIYCAMNQDEMKHNLKELSESVKSIVVAGLDINARIKKLPPQEEWQDDYVMVEQVNMMLEQKKMIVAEKEREEEEFHALKKEIKEYYQKHKVEALKHIFPNAEIHIGPAWHKSNREHGPCTLLNVDQEIQFNYASDSKK